MKPRSLAFAAAAVLLLIALLLVPATRWLVRLEAFPGLQGGGLGGQEFIQSHARDYQVQLGGQTDYRGQTSVQYARSLVPRFPDNPSLRANILRYAMQGEVHLRRPEENLLSSVPVPPAPPEEGHNAPADLAAFDADAAAGERLDPDNAYFPFMRAVGLFAAHRDDEGLAAIKRAGREHKWREYSEDEVEGHWRISEATFGGREGISRMATAAAVLFPHYQGLRAAARLVAVKAVSAEQDGRPQEGLALRLALARSGDLMRAQSTSLIGSLVGIAISAISRSRPGGIPAATHPPGVPAEQWAQERLDSYCDYVTRLGHPEAAREARAQAEAAVQVRHLTSDDLVFGSRLPDLARLGIGLAVGWVLAANLLLLLLLSCLALGLSRLSPLRDRLAPPLAVSLGVALAILLVLGGLAAWQMHGAASRAAILTSTPSGGNSLQAPLLLGLVFGAAFPCLLLLTSSIKAKLRRLPQSVGLVEGFRDAAPPLACALALLYGGLTLWTVHQENAVNSGLARSLRGEGQALAAQTGKPWPGPVRGS